MQRSIKPALTIIIITSGVANGAAFFLVYACPVINENKALQGVFQLTTKKNLIIKEIARVRLAGWLTGGLAYVFPSSEHKERYRW